MLWIMQIYIMFVYVYVQYGYINVLIYQLIYVFTHKMERKAQYNKSPKPIDLMTRGTVRSLDFGESCILKELVKIWTKHWWKGLSAPTDSEERLLETENGRFRRPYRRRIFAVFLQTVRGSGGEVRRLEEMKWETELGSVRFIGK